MQLICLGSPELNEQLTNFTLPHAIRIRVQDGEGLVSAYSNHSLIPPLSSSSGNALMIQEPLLLGGVKIVLKRENGTFFSLGA